MATCKIQLDLSDDPNFLSRPSTGGTSEFCVNSTAKDRKNRLPNFDNASGSVKLEREIGEIHSPTLPGFDKRLRSVEPLLTLRGSLLAILSARM